MPYTARVWGTRHVPNPIIFRTWCASFQDPDPVSWEWFSWAEAKGSRNNYYTLGYASYDLAGIYAYTGKKNLAYENLENLSRKQKFEPWFVQLIKHDPLFYSIREEPEFQQIVRDVESKYQAEHERVRKWLEENEML